MRSDHDYDTIVIGGGPGGATAAAFVAMQGGSVLLLEKDSFPRHQIGESLLPATVHGICGLLGLQKQMASQNFVRKRGGTFRWGKSPQPWTFKFARDSDAPGGYAYQVERSRFDKMLLDNARAKGVDVRERHSVHEIIFEEGRASGIVYSSSGGAPQRATAKFIVDAGGNNSQLYNKHVGERIYSRLFQNIALYAYFDGGKRLPPPNSGNILCCAFEDGWFWYIPLSETLTSVGAVVAKETATEHLQGGKEVAFQTFVSRCPMISEQLSHANRVQEGQYGSYRIRKDYSYCSSRFWTPGLALIGDAACFVDPVFSSGVHLATYSALLVARSINSCLRDGLEQEKVYFDEFERRYRREYGNFYQFCSAFYDMEQTTDSYFWAARSILNTPEKGNEAFIRLVAGVSSGSEPVFSSEEYFNARIGLGVWFQDMMSKNPLGEGVIATDERPNFNHEKFNPDKFMEGFTKEVTDLQLLAMYGSGRPTDHNSAGDLGLSRDGLAWERQKIRLDY